jgi:hypothetical protein
MPEVLTLTWAAHPVTLLDRRDILEYIRLFMGYDAERFVRQIIDDLENDERETETRMNSDLDSYEASLESNARAFGEIKSHVEHLQVELEKSRINKTKANALLTQIVTEISNQL